MTVNDLKFIVTGTPKVGKSAAIATLSEIPPVVAEEITISSSGETKSHSVVALDYGQVTLDDDTIVRLYGSPGQERFRSMWEVLADGALGLIILVDNSRPDPVYDMSIYFENFDSLIRNTSVVVGVSRVPDANPEELDKYYGWFKERGIFAPALLVDPRNKKDMSTLMEALVAMLEFA